SAGESLRHPSESEKPPLHKDSFPAQAPAGSPLPPPPHNRNPIPGPVHFLSVPSFPSPASFSFQCFFRCPLRSFFIRLICLYNLLHQRMTHHVLAGQFTKR